MNCRCKWRRHFRIFHILARYFHETRGSLNFLSIHNCSQNLPLISCVSAWKFQQRLALLCLISITGVKHLPALLAKKNFGDDPQFFLHVFGWAASDLQLCFVQLKALTPSVRYLTFKYPVTLKLGLGSLKVIKNCTTQSGTHDFLLTFHSNHRPISHRFQDKWQYRSKITIFSNPHVIDAPMKGFPLEFGIAVRGPKCLNDGATRWSKKF